jgi:hypothetical protein
MEGREGRREPAGLPLLAARFGLAEFDRAVLSIAAEVELARVELPEPDRAGRPTVGSVLVLLSDAIRGDLDLVVAHLGPGSALVRYGLVLIEGDGPFRTRSIRLLDDVWPRLLDPSFPGPLTVDPPAPDALDALALSPDVRAAVEAARGTVEGTPAIVVVTGPPGSGRGAIARAAFRDRPAIVVDGPVVDPTRLAREAIWNGAAVILDVPPPPLLVMAPIQLGVAAAPEGLGSIALGGRKVVEIRIPSLDLAARAAVWERHAGTRPTRVHARFAYGPAQIVAAVGAARRLARADAAPAERELHAAALELSRLEVPRLATRLDGDVGLDDLVLPDVTRRELDLIAAWASHGHTLAPHRLVDAGTLACLFHGGPGTGKTMAARALGIAIGLDVLRVDLAQVVDKYIGETEKQLDRLFSTAAQTHAILFFDEADALFGRRTQIRDAHDRYANIQTGFLLQRIEAHRGLVVLATNLRSNIDPAFARRLHVIVEFPAPAEVERRELWARHVPSDHTGDVDLDFLARRFELNGGGIRSAVLAARLFAAGDAVPTAMRHLLRGVFRELRREGRMIDVADFGPWGDELRTWANGAA